MLCENPQSLLLSLGFGSLDLVVPRLVLPLLLGCVGGEGGVGGGTGGRVVVGRAKVGGGGGGFCEQGWKRERERGRVS